MVPAGVQAGLGVLSGKYFAMPLDIFPNLLSVTGVAEESGAVPSYWAAHHENSFSKIISWVEFPALVLSLKETQIEAQIVLVYLPFEGFSFSLNETYLSHGSETGDLTQPMCHHWVSQQVSLHWCCGNVEGTQLQLCPRCLLGPGEHTTGLLPLSFWDNC